MPPEMHRTAAYSALIGITSPAVDALDYHDLVPYGSGLPRTSPWPVEGRPCHGLRRGSDFGSEAGDDVSCCAASNLRLNDETRASAASCCMAAGWVWLGGRGM